MRIEDYRQLCTSCDNFLSTHSLNDPYVASISCLHVLNGHTTHLSKYFSRQNIFIVALRFFLRALCKISSGLFFCLQRISISKFTNSFSDIDVVVFSHLLNPEQLKDSSDFYFGDLHNVVSANNKRVLFVLFNHTGQPEYRLWSDIDAKVSSRIPIINNLNPLEELFIALTQFKLFIRFRRATYTASIAHIPNFTTNILSGQTSSNLRFFKQIEDLFSKLKPSTVITTYEGHPWERLVFYAARFANSSVNCIAYQHAIIFPLQHSIQRSWGPLFDPNIVLFSGKTGLDWFVSHKNFSPTIDVAGTPRFSVLPYGVHSKLNSLRSNPCCLLP